jgi:hypothetical protein
MISIWYFIGLLILIYGILVAGAGIADWISPPAQPYAFRFWPGRHRH